MNGTSRGTLIALACCLFFCAVGVVFAPLLGIENDESLFGSVLYGPAEPNTIHFAGHRLPLMLMSYLGALKGWLYWPVFALWAPNAYSIRLPAVVAGAATVWLFFLLMRRIAGERAAVISAVLLAADSLFFLTTVYDWGPVALQHLLNVGALLALARFVERERSGDLALAFFLFGLALWDKAVFVWILVALAAAVRASFPREARRLFSRQRATIAAGAMMCGGLPLLVYNLNHSFATAHQDSAFAPQDVPAKFQFLIDSFRGGLFEFLTPPEGPWPVASFLGVLLALSLALWPRVWKWKRSAGRWMWCGFVFLAVGWLQMAVTRYAGTSVHHTILLWPIPVLIVAVALSALPARALSSAIVAVVAAHNVFVLYTYRTDLREQGSTPVWTEGVYDLARLTQPMPTQYFVMDWGMLENLVLLRQGQIALHAAWQPLIHASLTEAEKADVREWIARPTSVFLAHLRGTEIFKGCRENLDGVAREAGYRQEMLAVIKDAHGKAVFEAFRFVRE